MSENLVAHVPEPAVEQLRTCPDCGARLADGADVCWLCRANLAGDDALVAAEVVAPPRLPAQSVGHQALASLLLFAALAVVLTGVAVQAPGAAIALAFLSLPAFVAMLVVSGRKRRAGTPVTFSGRLATFLVALALGTFALGGIVVVILIAAFIACLRSL
ncbi:MAG: hypothetical protein R3C10_02425 [Pirellulales bacterium]